MRLIIKWLAKQTLILMVPFFLTITFISHANGPEPGTDDIVISLNLEVLPSDSSLSSQSVNGGVERNIASGGAFHVSPADMNSVSNLHTVTIVKGTFDSLSTKIPNPISQQRSQACGCDIDAQLSTCQMLRARNALTQFMAAQNKNNQNAQLHYNRFYGNLRKGTNGTRLEVYIKALLKNTWGVAKGQFINPSKMLEAWKAYESIIRNAPDNYLSKPPVALLAYKHFFSVVAEQKKYQRRAQRTQRSSRNLLTQR